jgi:DNA-binding winged helix-turn-helix (wHTH) protein
MSGAVVHRKLRFGPFELSIGERVLRRDGQVLPLGDRALDILTYLADCPGKVIAKQELIDHVWSDVTVEEGSLREIQGATKCGSTVWPFELLIE